MRKKGRFVCVVLGLALLLFMVPEVGAQWDEMEVIKYNFPIAASPPYQWYPEVEYNSVDKEFMVLWRTSGHPGNFQSMHGQRVSTDGAFLGDPIQLIAPNIGYKNGARFAHNMFTNEYMTAHPVSPTSNSFQSEILIARINNLGSLQTGFTSLWPSGGGESMLPEVIFNPTRREYLVVYSDRDIFPPLGYLNLVGFILDEAGNPIHGPFPVGNQAGGDYYAPYGVYNSTDDTYLVTWEDFRNVADWLEPCDVYGALLDHEGTMIVEVPVIDDFALGEPDAGDQRVPAVAYNPDLNKFFVVWEADEMPTVADSAIFGRYVNADGTLEPIITLVDEPRQQHWPDIEYIQEEQKYFMIWNDCRNDGQPAGTGWWESPAIDIYAMWLDDTGSPIGDEILIAEKEEVVEESWKQVPRMAYDPVKKRFLIAWYNRYESGTTAFGAAPSDVFATLYGIPPDAAISIGDQWANCGDVGVKIPICLINLEVEVGAVQVDLCENVDDCLICVGCEMTERTTIFDCMVNELENGCCALVVFSKNPGGVINPGECDIVIIDYTLKDDPQCCNSCIRIDGENLEIVDQYGYIVDSLVSAEGMICPFECGDIEPAASTAASWDCGDGDVDIFDILEEVDFIIHVKTPDDCQAVRADVPTGTPPNCDAPDGTIDVGDLMVIIDMALNRQDCCSYYYGGVIY